MTNIGAAIGGPAPTMTAVAGATGWSFSDDILSATFDKAYMGDFELPSTQGLPSLRGLYVKITFRLKPGTGYTKLKVLQFMRRITFYKGSDKPVPMEPGTWFLDRRCAAGWAFFDRTQGWMVDVDSNFESPFYSNQEHAGLEQGGATPSVTIWDTPGTERDKVGEGREFYTCAIGFKQGKYYFLGAVHWGYYIYCDGKIEFYPMPEFTRSLPRAIGAAIGQWNSLWYTERVPPIDGIPLIWPSLEWPARSRGVVR
jgi:hypothetical protein